MASTLPTAVLVYLERPAILTEIDAAATALIGDFGSDTSALLDLAFGRIPPKGKLPFDLPSSMTAVKNSAEDTPFDTQAPLYRFGHQLDFPHTEIS
ncbi:antitoxin component of RelBE/YafQ-DinJ toxin-antitoxin module [Streptomyces sp. TE33382]